MLGAVDAGSSAVGVDTRASRPSVRSSRQSVAPPIVGGDVTFRRVRWCSSARGHAPNPPTSTASCLWDAEYERLEMPYRALVRKGWPRNLQVIREELPEHLHHAPPSGAANYGSWVVVARVEGIPVGLAWAVHAAGNSNGAYIEEVAVRRSHHRRGIGKELLRQMATWMMELGREDVSILPTTGSRWVSRAGFQPVGGGRYEAVASIVSSRSPRRTALNDDDGH